MISGSSGDSNQVIRQSNSSIYRQGLGISLMSGLLIHTDDRWVMIVLQERGQL